MAKILPFRALRYDPRRVLLDRVVTQPYDKITSEMQDRYYQSSPFNLVRIILGKAAPGDDERSNVYSRAAEYFRQWRKAGVFLLDPQPALYLYSQRFSVPGATRQTCERRACIALCQLEDYGNGVVFPHERTLSAPKTDRLLLMRATRTQFGQLFLLYRDPDRAVDAMLTPAAPAEVELTDEYGVVHRLWPISDPDLLRKVQELMVPQKLVIADGHHRYETALNYRNECRAAAPGSDGPWERAMVSLVNADSPGLLILPTHRVVFGLAGFRPPSFLDALRRHFEIIPLAETPDPAQAVDILQESAAQGTSLMAVMQPGTYLLRRDPSREDPLLAALSPYQRKLDVVQLHKLVLEHALNISEEDIRRQRHVRYLRGADEAMQQVASGEAQVAFLMNPVPVEQVCEVAFAGEVLPQKSTDFYPKLLSGLTIYAMD